MCSADRTRFDKLCEKLPIPIKASIGSVYWKNFWELLDLNRLKKYDMNLCPYWWFLIRVEDKNNHKANFPTHKTCYLENYKQFIMVAIESHKVSEKFECAKEQIQINKIEGELYLPGTKIAIAYKTSEYDGLFTFKDAFLKIGLIKELLKESKRNGIESFESTSSSYYSDSDCL